MSAAAPVAYDPPEADGAPPPSRPAGTSGVPGTPRIAAPRLVGRADELALLTEALMWLPALVLVEGEAGTGKSRLVQEALTALGAEGPRVLVAGCLPLRTALTLGPVVDAVRQACDTVSGLRLSPLAGVLRPFFPEWSRELPPAPETLPDAGAARHRLLRALAELLDRLAVDVLLVEDIHWADETTLEFLVFLAARRPRPFSLVLTYRPDEVPTDSLLLRLSSRPAAGVAHARVTLGSLTVDATAHLISSMLDDEHVSPAFAAFLHERTEGLPLALEECVRLLHDRADIVRRNGEWARRTLDEIAVPPTIRDAVTERAARLGADSRRILLAAAVLGEGAQPTVLGRVGGLASPGAETAVAQAVASGLLVEDRGGRVAFRHALAARAVYDAAPAAERVAAHRAAVAVLEGERAPNAARIAHHSGAAGDTARWRAYARQAADLALESGDHLAAVNLLHRLITDPGCRPRASRRWCRRCRCTRSPGIRATARCWRRSVPRWKAAGSARTTTPRCAASSPGSSSTSATTRPPPPNSSRPPPNSGRPSPVWGPARTPPPGR